jgi:hypothetical protein
MPQKIHRLQLQIALFQRQDGAICDRGSYQYFTIAVLDCQIQHVYGGFGNPPERFVIY